MYLLFAWSKHSHQGGDDDFVGAFPTTDAAIAVFSAHEEQWKGECWIGHLVTFDGAQFTRLAWLCKEQGVTTIEWEKIQ